MDETAKTFEQRIFEPVLTAGYGELTEFTERLADRINGVLSFEGHPTGDVIAAILFAWAQDSTKEPANG